MPHPELTNADGMPQHEFFEGTDGRLAAALRRNGTSDWDPGHVELNHAELHADLALRAGIEEASNEATLEAPQSDIGRTAYNAFCSRHGIGTLPTGRPIRNRRRAITVRQEPYEEERVEATGPSSPPYEGNEQSKPSWLPMIMDQFSEIRAAQSRFEAGQEKLLAGQAQILAAQGRLERHVSDLDRQLERRFFGKGIYLGDDIGSVIDGFKHSGAREPARAANHDRVTWWGGYQGSKRRAINDGSRK
ncbi:hypothetical protein L6452_41229 [Arctium lappa]|uniref:Uncharacterized protein n=1 Tax=Arctium lappa TaxID=4217 RepID=A0ACB8XNM4_ARCLA|nr:hypothetical protein L6452_41229 [Arctium lappa]